MLRLDVDECSATLSSSRIKPVVHVKIGVSIDCVSLLESLAWITRDARRSFKDGNMPSEPEPEVEARSEASVLGAKTGDLLPPTDHTICEIRLFSSPCRSGHSTLRVQSEMKKPYSCNVAIS